MELLDVRAASLGRGDDINADDVDGTGTGAVTSAHITVCRSSIFTFSKRFGLQQAVTAEAAVSSRYSRYMLWVPERES